MRATPRLCFFTFGIAVGSLLIGAAGCRQSTGDRPAPAPVVQQAASAPAELPALNARLAKYHQQWLATTSPRVAEVYEQAIAALRADGLAQSAVRVGQHAPDFELPAADGRTLRLSELLRDGPVVIVWYRGGWCPYCTTALDAWQEAAPQFAAAGVTLLAISPQKIEFSEVMTQFGAVGFPLLSDAGCKVARQYGIAYTVSPAMRAQYAATFDLATYNDPPAYDLPIPATYVIDREGVVRAADIDPDYRRRAEPADVLSTVRDLAKPRD